MPGEEKRTLVRQLHINTKQERPITHEVIIDGKTAFQEEMTVEEALSLIEQLAATVSEVYGEPEFRRKFLAEFLTEEERKEEEGE